MTTVKVAVVSVRRGIPHARTHLVAGIFLGIGRSRAGVAFGENRVRAHLIFCHRRAAVTD